MVMKKKKEGKEEGNETGEVKEIVRIWRSEGRGGNREVRRHSVTKGEMGGEDMKGGEGRKVQKMLKKTLKNLLHEFPQKPWEKCCKNYEIQDNTKSNPDNYMTS